jgi:hypothetical protein
VTEISNCDLVEAFIATFKQTEESEHILMAIDLDSQVFQ